MFWMIACTRTASALRRRRDSPGSAVVGVLLRAFELRLIASQPEPSTSTSSPAGKPTLLSGRTKMTPLSVLTHVRFNGAVSSAQLDQEPASLSSSR